MILKINEAVQAYQKKHKTEQGTKVTRRQLAIKVMPEKSEDRAAQLLSRWSNGFDYSALTPDVILQLCRVLECTPNYLYDYDS